MFLTKLTVDPRSRKFRRDMADVHEMHRTVMSAYPELTEAGAFRQAHSVLWRVDTAQGALVQYVQSRTVPDWGHLSKEDLLKPAEVRSLQPVLDSVAAGRKFAFRLLGNPTRCIRTDANPESRKRVPHRLPEKQVEWLVSKGEQHGFVIPTGRQGGPDVAPSPAPLLIGKRREAQKVTVEPVRFDGHLIVTDPVAFTDALVNGIGRAKSYGCGLLSLAPVRAI